LRQPIQVAVLGVRLHDDEREYLMLQRDRETGGFWQSVSGGVEDDEQIIETARRELIEETGFEPVSLEAIGYSSSFAVPNVMKHHYQSDVTHLVQHYFSAIVEAKIDPIIDLREHDDWRWCNYGQAERLIYWPDKKKALRICEAYLDSKID